LQCFFENIFAGAKEIAFSPANLSLGLIHAGKILESGGKRSATPLSEQTCQI